jgi:hypothetical protein
MVEQYSNSKNNEIRELCKFEKSYGNSLFLSIDSLEITSQLQSNLPINNQTLTDLQEKIWYVVKTNKSDKFVVNTTNSNLSQYKYELRKNDIIKLGRIKFLIKNMNIVDGSYSTTKETFKSYEECE